MLTLTETPTDNGLQLTANFVFIRATDQVIEALSNTDVDIDLDDIAVSYSISRVAAHADKVVAELVDEYLREEWGAALGALGRGIIDSETALTLNRTRGAVEADTGDATFDVDANGEATAV